MVNKKLGIVVPYRNRFEQLQEFKREIKKYLKRKKIPHEIFVVQQDDAKLFNRGMLLNIGYTYAKNSQCDYVVFHDVDMLPFRVDYSYSDIPIHLATRFKNISRTTFEEYFGGVTMFPMEQFEKINGYSNKYWGWGYEDTDLLYRCIKNNLKLDTLKIKNQYSNNQKLRFNGSNAYVRGKNKFDFTKPLTFFISFKPDELTCNVEQYTDDFNIFTIPGYDFSISYNSYSRYTICLFNRELKPLFANSEIIRDYYTNIAITIDPSTQEIKIYQDGKILDTIKDFGEIYDYDPQEYFYIGMGNPLSETGFKYYKGLFPNKTVNVIPTLMIEETVKKIIPQPKDKVIIGGNLARWYGGFESYIIAQEFNLPIWTQTSHAKRENEDELLNHLPRVFWTDWMKQLSNFKYAIHLMPTVAAGTFSLNCAYFGIPCIGNKNVDTQRLCHPDLSIEVHDLEKAKFLAKKLKTDFDFYTKCSETAKLNYKTNYSLESFKNKIFDILNKHE